MKKAILGKKIGMTQLFMPDGTVYPVTLIQAGPCTVVQKKTLENDGYEAIQVGYVDIDDKRVNKPSKGHFEKAGLKPKRYIKEFRLEDNTPYSVGQEINADVFSEGEFVDVTGTSKGKGFAGSIKRWGFSRGPMAHGSNFHRAPGSLGSIAAARVFKGRKLPGRMGADRVTVQGLKILKVDSERNVLAVKGAIPGNKNGLVIVKNTVKVDKK